MSDYQIYDVINSFYCLFATTQPELDWRHPAETMHTVVECATGVYDCSYGQWPDSDPRLHTIKQTEHRPTIDGGSYDDCANYDGTFRNPKDRLDLPS